MDADRALGPYVRWVLRHPVLVSIQTIALGVIVFGIGAFVFHSTFVVVVALVAIALALLSSGLRLLAFLGARSSKKRSGKS